MGSIACATALRVDIATLWPSKPLCPLWSLLCGEPLHQAGGEEVEVHKDGLEEEIVEDDLGSRGAIKQGELIKMAWTNI